VDEWLTGRIEEVQYDEHRAYKFKNKDTNEWEEGEAPHVRFKFKLDGYQWPHYSRWMKCSTHEKSNFYSKYLKFLCPQYDCQDKVVDLDKLVGLRVKTMWEDDGDYQHITQIRGLDPTINAIASGTEIAPGLTEPPEPTAQGEEEDENVPF
jgi:hypothetical protein